MSAVRGGTKIGVVWATVQLGEVIQAIYDVAGDPILR